MKFSGFSKHGKHLAQNKTPERAEAAVKDEIANDVGEAQEITIEEIDKAIAEAPQISAEFVVLDEEYERGYEQAKSIVEAAQENAAAEAAEVSEPEVGDGSGDGGNDGGGEDEHSNDEDDEPESEEDDEPKLSPEEIEAEIAAYQALKRKKRKKRLIIAVSIIGAIILAAAAFWFLFPKKPTVNSNAGPITYNENTEPTKTNEDHLGKTDSNTTTEQTSTQQPEENGEEEPTDATGRKKNVYTFLIVGNDNGYGNTDTIMVGMLDVPNSKLNMVSIPRDTMVNKSWEVKKVNTIYTFDKGIDGLKRGIAELTGYEVDSYCVVDLDAFKALVDAIGGVDFYVPQNMDYDAPDQNLYIHFKEGMQHLNGEDALKVVRFRAGYAGGDIQRIQTQQDFLKAVAKKCLSISSVFKIDDFADIFKKYVDTDLSAQNIVWYVQQLMNLKEGDITFITLPENYNDSVKGLSYCTIKLDEWLEVINEYINPFNVEITAENLNVITRDANRNLYATTGSIAGGINSFYDWYAHFGNTETENETENTEPPTTVTAPDPGPSEPTIPPVTGGEQPENPPETGEGPETPPETGGETGEEPENPPENGGETGGEQTETPSEETTAEPGGEETPTEPAPQEGNGEG